MSEIKETRLFMTLNLAYPEKIEDIIATQTYATFGPDELSEARNRGYRLGSCCSAN